MSPIVPVSRGAKLALVLAASGSLLAVPTFAYFASAAPLVTIERHAEMAASPVPVIVTVAFPLAAVGLMQSFGYAALLRRHRFAVPTVAASLALLTVASLLDDLHRRITAAGCAPYEPCPVEGVFGVNTRTVVLLIGLVHGLGSAMILVARPRPRLNEPRATAGILLALVALSSPLAHTWVAFFLFIGLGIAANLVVAYVFLGHGLGRPPAPGHEYVNIRSSTTGHWRVHRGLP